MSAPTSSVSKAILCAFSSLLDPVTARISVVRHTHHTPRQTHHPAAFQCPPATVFFALDHPCKDHLKVLGSWKQRRLGVLSAAILVGYLAGGRIGKLYETIGQKREGGNDTHQHLLDFVEFAFGRC